MIKFNHGSITNPTTGESKDVIVKAVAPNKVKDIVIGGGLVLLGIAYLTFTAFRNGANKFEVAELKTLSDLDLM